MDFALNEDEIMIQDSAKKYLESLGGIQLAYDYITKEDDVSDSLWNGIADLGYTGILVPEAYGGIDLGMTGIIPVAEELGRVLAPIPYIETSVFAVSLLNKVGTEKLKETYLTGIANGKYRFALCMNSTNPISSEGSTTIQAIIHDNGFVLSGKVSSVRYGPEANVFLVIATVEDQSGNKSKEVFLVESDLEGIKVEHQTAFDKTGQAAVVTFDNVLIGFDSLLKGQSELKDLQEAMDVMNATLCSNMVGGMEELVALSTEYANIRKQFGQPIGRFQSIKHRIADMKVELDMARSLAYYAALAIQDENPNIGEIVSSAKSYCSEAYVRIASHNIQIHGAIGVTEEHDSHLYLKRSKFAENYGGSPNYHRERISDYIFSAKEDLLNV